MNRVGDRTFKYMCKQWMRSQKRKGDGLHWISRLFRPTIFKRLTYRLVNRFMLEKDEKALSRGVRRMPFRKALKRDVWEPSPAAVAVGERWDNVRRSGGKTAFNEE